MGKDKNVIDTRYAESLPEIYAHVNDIYKNVKRPQCRPLLWFRGHEYAHYNLDPNLFRRCEYLYNKTGTYSRNHLREEYRFQNFMSRNYDKVDMRMPQTMIEWQEVMQHYQTRTRLMDWSESLTVALEFALEAFIRPVKDLEVNEHCRTATPVLWVLQPTEINKEVYRSFVKGPVSLIENALHIRLGADARTLAKRIQTELRDKEKEGIYFNLPTQKEGNMNVMIGLSALEMLRNAYMGREWEALWDFEMNPFFYLLLRYYSDGIPVKQDQLPPLAIIHPYHSPRIKNQRGVFTVFPYYILSEQQREMNAIAGKDLPIAMEYMKQCIPYLHKIQILNPQRVADELMVTGAKRGNLYPDMQSISEDMENVVI
ncbi:MAG: FRG domain-containing protein [Lachnospiraceae bacterium]|nr:FRG domain-containing protein [Lachnospiraceae bacterium]